MKSATMETGNRREDSPVESLETVTAETDGGTEDQSEGSLAEGLERVTAETDCRNFARLRSGCNNPFLVDEADGDSENASVCESVGVVAKVDSEVQRLIAESGFTDSVCQSEADSVDLKVGEALTSSMMTSGIEVLDSSDIEIIREERGSADSIEILESSVSMTSGPRPDSPENELNDETVCDTDVFDFSVSPSQDRSASNGAHHSSAEELSGARATQDTCDTLTLKSGSNDDFQSRGDTPVSNTSDSSPSGAHPNIGYSKLQESNPSSYSPSPYDSPTHVALGSSQNQPPGDSDHARPDSLSLPRPLQLYERQRFAQKESYSSLSEYSSRSGSMDALIEAATSTPLHSQGTVSVEENPGAKWLNEMTPRSRSSSSISSTTSGWSASVASRATRSPSSVYTQSPDDIPPIDPKALFDVEMHARKVAESLDALMQSLVVKLHKMSTNTYNTLDVYREAVDRTCDTVDANIKSMYALMAKCEELNRTMKPVYHIQDQIKEVKRLLDLFETQVSDDEP